MSALSDALNEANVNGWSAAEIARRSGDRIHRATAANVMRGKHAQQPSDEVLEAFSIVFPKLTVPKLRALAGLPAGEAEPYRPPVEANRLTMRQRRAVDELIRAMVEGASGGEHGGRDTAPIAKTKLDAGWNFSPNLVLTASTGSGKTEAFLVALMKHAHSDPSTALRQLSEYYLESDDIDAELFAMVSAELGELVAAARSGVSAGRAQRRVMDAAGEENQDPEGDTDAHS